jgi:hypothetical protein
MPKILERLVRQLRGRGEKNPKERAYQFLNKAGIMSGNKLTTKGEKRNAMTPAERAKDRQAKYNGGKPSDYTYHKATNSATRKGGKRGR